MLFSRQILNRSLEFKILVVRALDKLSKYSEVRNRRADRNKQAGWGKNSTHPQFLEKQLTLYQPGGTDYAHLITTGTHTQSHQ